MKMRILPALACTLLLPIAAHAAPLVLYGHDRGLGEQVRLTTTANADAARDAFLARLDDAITEDFERFREYAGYQTGLSLDFGALGTSTLQSTDNNKSLWVDAVALGTTNTKGRYAISGLNYLQVSSSHFQLNFSQPVSAFGFYGIDIGDFSGRFTLEVFRPNGVSTSYSLDDTYRSPGGGVLYWGLIDAENPFSSIRFGNSNSGTDWFGFDDMTIANAKPQPVSEPGALGLLGLGVAVLGFTRRRKVA
ncbi:PEP-CTERM sorting domain-containing protein [Thauera sp.]|jgi:hypothetical protein|uniref:PEP-CTERM sorting domain-containing protein n=1 Tax=Thauera sp. TaxID=1905334 RepID=UPI002A35B923|nr:PEP-CTERM sorting domain-containing protein [Thauera sp.]MDX9886571.1 PEP-CTERM sorting domain-containing protein [Thauera sp.]